MVTLLASCSLWPWRAEKTGSCLDDDSCKNTNPLDEQLVGGSWYCYGSDRDEPWDCSQTEDTAKIAAIPEVSEELEDEEIAYSTPILKSASQAPEARVAPAPVQSEVPQAVQVEEAPEPAEPARTETTFSDEVISHSQPELAEPVAPTASRITGSTADRLFDASDNQFAVQLIALQTLEEVEQFVDDHGIRRPMFVKIRSQGSDWHVVILGVYDNQSEAQRVAADWEAEHNPASKPWIRPVGPLKRAALSSRG